MNLRDEIIEAGQEIGLANLALLAYLQETHNLERDIAKRKLALVPVGGWQGKNVDARKLEEEMTYAIDEKLQELLAKLHQIENDVITIEYSIKASEAHRRAAEWCVRLLEITNAPEED